MSRPCHCGCCAGIGIATPATEANPPGLTALRYRAGTYASFYESMLARLTNLPIDVPSPYGDERAVYNPLKALTTRSPDDPSIALLDAFAVVADVLTFYQERIANEGYLPTAIERRSIAELGRLIGYRLRPGVAASVYLAFTVAADFKGDLPAGTRAQSIPGAGELPQFFETSDVLDARAEWNALRPRLSRPLLIGPASSKEITSVKFLDSAYLAGTSVNLKVGDPLLFVLGEKPGLQTMLKIEAVDAQDDDKRTQLTFVPAGDEPLTNFADKAKKLFPGSALAAEVADILARVVAKLSVAVGTNVSVAGARAMLEQRLALAERRRFTRLTVVIRRAAGALGRIPGSEDEESESKMAALSPIAELLTIATPLSRPPSVPPANATRLGRSVAQSFSPRSDLAPRIVAALKPAAANVLYSAWTNVVKRPGRLETHALRVHAGLFASTYSGAPTVKTDDNKVSTTTYPSRLGLVEAWPSLVDRDLDKPPTAVALDATYDRIKPGSWVVIDRPEIDIDLQEKPSRVVTYHRVEDVRVAGMDTGTGFTAKVTLLTLKPQWLSDVDAHVVGGNGDVTLRQILQATPVLRNTIVHAQSEPLALAGEPLDADVAGDTVDLPEVLDGLEAGRWLIVSGERTDVPGVSGVTASELVMLAGVSQVTDAALGASDVSVDFGKLHTRLTFATSLAYSYNAATVTIHGNVANATHGQTVGEVLGDGDGSVAFQSMALRQGPLTFVSAPTAEGAASTLVARVNDIAWHETDSLAAAGPSERVFVTSADEDDKTMLVFGNGVHGARLPTGVANVKATYRYGIGKTGNVKANQISQLATHPLGLQGVINPIAASGGADRDDAEAGRANAPLALMALDRLVSVRDYADFARTYAGIGKTSAARLSDGRRQLVHLTVAGVDDIQILQTSDLYRNLVASLEAYGDPHLPIQVCTRKVRLLVLSAAVAVLPDYTFEAMEPKIRAALLEHFGFATRDLGQSAFLSEAVAVIHRVEGVAYADFQVFDSIAEDADATTLVGLAKSLKRHQHVLARRARLDPAFDPATPDDPCLQVLPAELVYLTPAIPDTLILTEVGR